MAFLSNRALQVYFELLTNPGHTGLKVGTVPVFRFLSEGHQPSSGHQPLLRLAISGQKDSSCGPT